MNSDCNRKDALVFVLIPIVFNALIWQNYMTCAQCLLPGCCRCWDSTIAFLAFGLVFGTVTALFAKICLTSVLSVCSVFKNETVNNHLRRHRTYYNLFWVAAFTWASYAGFLFMIGFRPASAAMTQIYLYGFQGYLVAGMTAGVLAILTVAVSFAILNGIQLLKRA